MKEKIAIVEKLVDNVEEYAKTVGELYKLKTVKKASSVIGVMISSIILFLFLILFLIIISIGASVYLGEILGRMHLGFMIIAGFYAIILIILILARKSLLINNFTNMMINSLLKEKDDASN